MLFDVVFKGQLYSCICNHLMQDNQFFMILFFFVVFLPNGGINCSSQVEIFGLIKYDVIYIYIFVFVRENSFSSKLDCNSAFITVPFSDILPE